MTGLPLLVLLFSALGCSRHNQASTGQNQAHDVTDGGKNMAEMDPAVTAALTRMEATGKLEGVEFEHYVGGGLPPPYYVSDQFRLLTRDGRDTIQFAAPNYKSKPDKDEAYPSDVYTLPAQPDDVKTLARILREGRAFEGATMASAPADGVRTELLLTVAGKQHKATYWGFPPTLTPLGDVVKSLIARVKSHGKHELRP